jgi:hypothetical protein
MKKNKIYTTQYSDVHVQFCNTERSKRGVINMETKILNGLPNELKNEMNLNVFKRKLKGYLICNVFYSLQEFFKK